MSDLTNTPELETHHDIVPARRGAPASIKTRFAALFESGAIDEAEHAACIRWLRDWDLGMEGASPGGSMKVRVDADNGGSALDRRIDAMSRLRSTQARLLPPDWFALVGCIAHDMTWTRLGRIMSVSDVSARKRSIKAIKQLTVVYALIDAGKPRRISER